MYIWDLIFGFFRRGIVVPVTLYCNRLTSVKVIRNQTSAVPRTRGKYLYLAGDTMEFGVQFGFSTNFQLMDIGARRKSDADIQIMDVSARLKSDDDIRIREVGVLLQSDAEMYQVDVGVRFCER